MTGIKTSYFYGEQAEQFSYIRIPRELVVGAEYSGLTVQAKLLYGILLERMGRAYENKWIDEENRVYVIYSIEDIQADLKMSKHKAVESLAELEQIGLIVKRKRGKGLPNQIYVKNFSKIQPINVV